MIVLTWSGPPKQAFAYILASLTSLYDEYYQSYSKNCKTAIDSPLAETVFLNILGNTNRTEKLNTSQNVANVLFSVGGWGQKYQFVCPCE